MHIKHTTQRNEKQQIIQDDIKVSEETINFNFDEVILYGLHLINYHWYTEYISEYEDFCYREWLTQQEKLKGGVPFNFNEKYHEQELDIEIDTLQGQFFVKEYRYFCWMVQQVKLRNKVLPKLLPYQKVIYEYCQDSYCVSNK
jgi:hypothetical protein